MHLSTETHFKSNKAASCSDIVWACCERETVTVTVMMSSYLCGVEVAGDALQDDGPVLQGGADFTEAQVELGVDGANGLQAELVRVVHAQQRRY